MCVLHTAKVAKATNIGIHFTWARVYICSDALINDYSTRQRARLWFECLSRKYTSPRSFCLIFRICRHCFRDIFPLLCSLSLSAASVPLSPDLPSVAASVVFFAFPVLAASIASSAHRSLSETPSLSQSHLRPRRERNLRTHVCVPRGAGGARERRRGTPSSSARTC